MIRSAGAVDPGSENPDGLRPTPLLWTDWLTDFNCLGITHRSSGEKRT
jgi:hypothetical protein